MRLALTKGPDSSIFARAESVKRAMKVERTAGMAKKKQSRKGLPSSSEDSPQAVLIRALSHPVRSETLRILSEKAASPSEMAAQLDIKLSNTSYHVRVLHNLNLIEVVDTERVRGAVATFYRVVDKPLIDNPSWK